MLADVRLVASVIRNNGGRFVALTGAGCSTESGIPDYRSPGTGLYSRRPNFQPLTIQRFMTSTFEQQRYWGRSLFGYRGLSHKDCGASHNGLHRLCNHGTVPLIITQNVDGLHHLARHGGTWRGVPSEVYESPNGVSAGAESCDDFGAAVDNGELIELHGNIHLVACMRCGHRTPREAVQRRLVALNGALLNDGDESGSRQQQRMRPDADYELEEHLVSRVRLLRCGRCGEEAASGQGVEDFAADESASTSDEPAATNGHLRPDVVLFGENVPEARVRRCYDALNACPVLVCFGTSLQVHSAYRFVKHVADMRAQRPKDTATGNFAVEPTVIIVNRDPTRGDPLATVRVETESVGEFITCLERELNFCYRGGP